LGNPGESPLGGKPRLAQGVRGWPGEEEAGEVRNAAAAPPVGPSPPPSQTTWPRRAAR
jgi:hypothetical protein